MFRVLSKAIAITFTLAMLKSSQCQTPVFIHNDRVYRYVGSRSQTDVFADQLSERSDNDQPMSDQPMSGHNDASQQIPESVLIQMKDVNDAQQFISKFLVKPTNTASNTIFLEYLHRGTSGDSSHDKDLIEDRLKLTKLPKISSPAGCYPEMQIIELMASGSRNELYFPSCVRLPRCSGCCPSRRLRCVPLSKSFEDITVIRVNYSTVEHKFKFEGFKVFRIEKHDNCSCDCIQKWSDCTASQVFVSSECRCVCANSQQAELCPTNANKFWDNNECECKCKAMPLCSTGLIFNNSTCRCEEEKQMTNNTHIWPNATLQNYSHLMPFKYFGSENEDKEIQAQKSKGLNLFNTKGINPEFDNEYDDHL